MLLSEIIKNARPCASCGELFWERRETTRTCSLSCRHRGKLHPNWKGGKKINSQGYRLILSPDHPFKDKQGYVREHRLVMEKKLGRYLKPDEEVHHKNQNKLDNRLENLQLMTFREHLKWHRDHYVSKKVKIICQRCKKEFLEYPSRKKRKWCSKECYLLSKKL